MYSPPAAWISAARDAEGATTAECTAFGWPPNPHRTASSGALLSDRRTWSPLEPGGADDPGVFTPNPWLQGSPTSPLNVEERLHTYFVSTLCIHTLSLRYVYILCLCVGQGDRAIAVSSAQPVCTVTDSGGWNRKTEGQEALRIARTRSSVRVSKCTASWARAPDCSNRHTKPALNTSSCFAGYASSVRSRCPFPLKNAVNGDGGPG
jgi:hypothetical protein